MGVMLLKGDQGPAVHQPEAGTGHARPVPLDGKCNTNNGDDQEWIETGTLRLWKERSTWTGWSGTSTPATWMPNYV